MRAENVKKNTAKLLKKQQIFFNLLAFPIRCIVQNLIDDNSSELADELKKNEGRVTRFS